MSPALEHLHDIILPEPVSWMPRTAGWWIVLAILFVIGLYTGIVAVRRYRANRYRRLALAELARLDEALAAPATRPAALGALPRLIKRTALATFPRETVAALSGDAWLRFLDRTYDGDGFTAGPGRLLPVLAYAPDRPSEMPSPDDLQELSTLVRRWIRRHHVRV